MAKQYPFQAARSTRAGQTAGDMLSGSTAPDPVFSASSAVRGTPSPTAPMSSPKPTDVSLPLPIPMSASQYGGAVSTVARAAQGTPAPAPNPVIAGKQVSSADSVRAFRGDPFNEQNLVRGVYNKHTATVAHEQMADSLSRTPQGLERQRVADSAELAQYKINHAKPPEQKNAEFAKQQQDYKTIDSIQKAGGLTVGRFTDAQVRAKNQADSNRVMNSGVVAGAALNNGSITQQDVDKLDQQGKLKAPEANKTNDQLNAGRWGKPVPKPSLASPPKKRK